MALTFTGSGTRRVGCGSASSLDNLSTWTACAWLYPTGTTEWSNIFSKDGGGAAGYRMAYTESPWTRIACDVARSTSNTSYASATGTLVQNTWNYVGFTFDIAGSANEVIQIYKGNLTTVAAEISYAYRTDGSGTLNSDAAANFSIGNASGYGAAWPGTIAWFAHWNRVLTLAEVVEQQFNPHVTSGCVLFMHLGYNGTGTQPDWSGNGNNGTVTSATVSDHVPLGPMLRTRRRSGYVVGGTIYTKSVSGSLTIAGVPVKKTKRSLSGVL